MLTRAQVIERFLAMFPHPHYLEVGVSEGATFNSLQAARKVAVDPRFQFDTAAFAVPGTIEFHETTSDAFFAKLDPATRFHVIYLDGLHTFEQTLRDLQAALTVLAPDGIIILDDILPNSFDAALPDLDEVFLLRRRAAEIGANWHYDGSWMGDVFKVVFFIESFMQHLSYASVVENHGQTVIWRQTRPEAEVGLRSVEQIARMDYRNTILDRPALKLTGIDDIVRRVEASTRHPGITISVATA